LGHHCHEQPSNGASFGLVKREVSEIVLELNLTDCGFVTITAAKISPRLKEGRIYLSVMVRANKNSAPRHARSPPRTHPARAGAPHRPKYTPRLKFFLDETEAHASHIEHLLANSGRTCR